MKNSIKNYLSFISKSEKRAIREGDGITDMQKKEKFITLIIYLLFIVITISLMLFLLNI